MTLLALTAVAAEVAAEQASDTALIEGAILLGVATLFVLLFRRLGLGAVLGSHETTIRLLFGWADQDCARFPPASTP